MKELKSGDVKGMYEKLCKKLSDYPGGVDQFVDFRSIARRCGFKITKLFRGKDYVKDHVSARYEVWMDFLGNSSKAGKGDSLGEAVQDAKRSCFIMNSIYQEPPRIKNA